MNNNNPIHPNTAIVESAKTLQYPECLQIVGQDITQLNTIAKQLWKTKPWNNAAYIPDNAFETLNANRSIYHHFMDIRTASLDALHLLCQQFQFPLEKLHHKPRVLSSGQSQLIAIMLAWYQNPQILIANQPFQSLDIRRRENLIELFNKSNISLILLTPYYLDYLNTQHILYCEDEQKQHAFLLKRSKSTHTIIKLHKVILQHTPLSPISLSLYQEITGLVGPNGSGKTSLAKTIMHDLPYTGQIDIKEENFHKAKTLYKKRILQLMFQNASQSFNPDHPLGNILLEPHLNQTIFLNTLHAFPPVNDWEKEYPKDVSISTLKTLSFARIIARNPTFIILDEPLAGMNSTWINALFQKLLSLNIGVLIIDHDIDALKTICNEIYTIQHGSLHVL